ncbi:Serine endoprotease DegS [Nymphon striatum]|nr:Serine endoprotease DegS [Nymphon striatum]
MPFLTKSFILIFLAAISSSTIANTRNPAPSQPVPSQETQLKQSNVGPYLGLRVDVLSKELTAQLPEDILVGQGIMVSGYMDKSPAPQQGIQLYDILLNYNQHALMHPRTIIQLIKRQKPGDKAELTIVRKGKIIKLPITIGSQNYALNEDQLDYQYNLQVLGYDGVKIKQHSKASLRSYYSILSS